MKNIPFLLLLTLLCAPITASALTDREDVSKWCKGHSIVASGRCIGFMLAVEDALSLGPVEGFSACIPRDVTLNQMYKALLGWLPEHPDAEARTGLGLVAQAFAASYPCGPD